MQDIDILIVALAFHLRSSAVIIALAAQHYFGLWVGEHSSAAALLDAEGGCQVLDDTAAVVTAGFDGVPPADGALVGPGWIGGGEGEETEKREQASHGFRKSHLRRRRVVARISLDQ